MAFAGNDECTDVGGLLGILGGILAAVCCIGWGVGIWYMRGLAGCRQRAPKSGGANADTFGFKPGDALPEGAYQSPQ